MSDPEIVVLDDDRAAAALDALAWILEDCVAGGDSVNFTLPFSSRGCRLDEATRE